MTPLTCLRGGRHRRAQALLEYTLLVATVVAALVAMVRYVQKAFNAQSTLIDQEFAGGP